MDRPNNSIHLGEANNIKTAFFIIATATKDLHPSIKHQTQNQMTNTELKQLDTLLESFINFHTTQQSLYGRNMDIGLAKSLRSALVAYGLSYTLTLTCYDGSKHTSEHYCKDRAERCAKYFIETKNDPANTGYNSQPVSYTIS